MSRKRSIHVIKYTWDPPLVGREAMDKRAYVRKAEQYRKGIPNIH